MIKMLMGDASPVLEEKVGYIKKYESAFVRYLHDDHTGSVSIKHTVNKPKYLRNVFMCFSVIDTSFA